MVFLDWNAMLIFGDFTPLFFSLIALAYVMTVGGILKGLYAGSLINLLIIVLTYWLNSYFHTSLDLISLVVLEIFLAVVWILSLGKT
jgi:hypothetical protein